MDNREILTVRIKRFLTRALIFVALITLLCIGAIQSGNAHAGAIREEVTMSEGKQ